MTSSIVLNETDNLSALTKLCADLPERELTLIALSGGVDSSVSAIRAVERYKGCVGITLLMQHEPHQVPAKQALERAIQTCVQLGIPHITYDVSSSFTCDIVQSFAHSYAQGETPNPCILCNPLIKFGKINEVADHLGATRIITGHYANIVSDAQGAKRLKRAHSISKDQTYFMYRVTPAQLARVELMLGTAQSKDDVRREADMHNLPAAHTPDSMDVCFLEHEDRLALIERLAPQAMQPGPLVDCTGKLLGTHKGIARVTIGQRKGLDYAGGKRLYVRSIDASTNQVQIAELADLLVDCITIDSIVWHTTPIPQAPYSVQLRYRSQPVLCSVELSNNDAHPHRATVHLDSPVLAVAPGQSAVLYDENDLVVGGGFITDVTYHTPTCSQRPTA